MQWQSNPQSGPMYPYIAPGQQQGYSTYNYQGNNNLSQWQPPSQSYQSNAPFAQPNAPSKVPDSQLITGEAEGIHYELLYRDVNTLVRCHLPPNTSINLTAGVMAGMSANLKLEGKFKIKKLFSADDVASSTVTAPNGPGELLLAPPAMSDVMPLHISGDNEWFVGESCFLAWTTGVQKSFKRQTFKQAFFSGEGLFVTKLTGNGVAFVTSLGAIHSVQLQPGQEYIIDNDHLVAWSASMTYKVENMTSFMTSMISDEGKVCRFSGPGTVYMQTRNPDSLATYLRSLGICDSESK